MELLNIDLNFAKKTTNLFAFDMMDCRLYSLDANSDNKIRTPAKFPMKQQASGDFANIYLVLILHLKRRSPTYPQTPSEMGDWVISTRRRLSMNLQ